MNTSRSSSASSAPQRALGWKSSSSAATISATGTSTPMTGAKRTGTPKSATAFRDPARSKSLAVPATANTAARNSWAPTTNESIPPMLRSILRIGKLLQSPALAENTGAHDLTFETFGLHVRVVTDSSETPARIPPLLPPGWQPSSTASVDTTFTFTPGPGDTVELAKDGSLVLDDWRLDVALVVFQRELRTFVALEAPDLVFVHAGVVAHKGHAIVIPGKTYAGKTSLAAALVRAGATYYSDEYAPLDELGLVHPFAKPLSLRKGGGQIDHEVASLGGVAGEEPVPVGM